MRYQSAHIMVPQPLPKYIHVRLVCLNLCMSHLAIYIIHMTVLSEVCLAMCVCLARWGIESHCAHGDFFTCTDRYNPGKLMPHKWENCQTVDKYVVFKILYMHICFIIFICKPSVSVCVCVCGVRLSWGFRRNIHLSETLTRDEIIEQLVRPSSLFCPTYPGHESHAFI
jgi:hypothetical protein